MPKSKPADPLAELIRFTTIRDAHGRTVSVRGWCTHAGCQWDHEAVTPPLCRQAAVAHVARHGVVIEASYGRPERTAVYR